MGILGTFAETIFDVNLIVQLLLVVIMALGFYKRRRFAIHGRIMALATLINLGATALVMVPSLIINFGAIVAAPFSPGVLITIAHGILGSTAIVLGSLFSVRFLIATRNAQPLACGTRWMMISTILLWLFALVGGLAFYSFYYL